MADSVQRYIDQVTRNSKSSFYYTFFFLEPRKREAMHTIYSFCRISDDIVDNDTAKTEKEKQLNIWEDQLNSAFYGHYTNPYFKRLEEIRSEFNIPKEYFLDLLKGMRMDLQSFHFNNFNKLKEYCYYVASVVGLMCIEIFGYKHEQTKEYAINLGIALQLTNMIRDYFHDLKNGRIYFPEEELSNFKVENKRTINSEMLDFLSYQIERAKQYYKLASENLHPDDRKSMIVAEMMNNIYYRLLLKIEKHLKDLPDRLIRLNKFQKMFISFSTYLRTKY